MTKRLLRIARVLRVTRTSRSLRPLAVVLALGAFALSACGSGDEASDTTTTTGAVTTTTAGDEAATADDETADEDGAAGDACPETTTITVTTAAGTTATVDAVTSYVDILGDNDGSTAPQSATLTFSDTQISSDDARGILTPTLAGNQVVAVFNLSNTAGPITPGVDYVDGFDQPGLTTTLNSTSIYTGAGRSLPTEDHVVTFTEVNEERACGTVTSTGTDYDRVDIAFVAGRIDA